MLNSEIEAQAETGETCQYPNVSHWSIVNTLEGLICEFYQSGNEQMERFFRDVLDDYERMAYDK